MSKVDVPETPNTRKEAYLAAIAGQAVEVPAEPITREEAYLNAILNNGGGGGGGDTVSITPTYTDGIKVADYNINGVNGAIYVPVDPKPPVLRVENIYSLNDVNEISASFTAQKTSDYMLIMAIGNDQTNNYPEISEATVTVNGNDETVNSYYSSESFGFGVDSKIALLSLTQGDTVAASLKSLADSYSTSAFIALISVSYGIDNFVLADSDCSVTDDPEIEYISDTDTLCLLFFFSRFNGVGGFDLLLRNTEVILNNVTVCSDGEGWQLSHGICAIYAKDADDIQIVAKNESGMSACGIIKVRKSVS